jgi:hypothetical protein
MSRDKLTRSVVSALDAESSTASQSAHTSPNSTSVSTSSLPSVPTSTHPAALVGFGTLQSEEELRSALGKKDRLFLVVVGKELEGFVRRVLKGVSGSEQGSVSDEVGDSLSGAASVSSAPTPTVSSASRLAAIEPSMTLATQATTPYLRVLVYKAAEWYGLRAVAGPDGSMLVGVFDKLAEKRCASFKSELITVANSTSSLFRQIRPFRNSASCPGAKSTVKPRREAQVRLARDPRMAGLGHQE